MNRMTNEEKKALDKSYEDEYKEIRIAAEAHRQVLSLIFDFYGIDMGLWNMGFLVKGRAPLYPNFMPNISAFFIMANGQSNPRQWNFFFFFFLVPDV